MTRRSEKSRASRRAALVAKMMTVVEELIEAGESFAEVSVERLITGAGISRTTFYVYFEDKGVLLLALAEDVVTQLVGAAEVWWSLPPGAEEADLERALGGIMDVYRRHQRIWGALVDASAYDPNVRESFRGIVEQAADGLAAYIRRGQKEGHLRAGLDPDRTAAWLTWMTERGLYQRLPGASDAELKKLLRAQTDIVWFTLYEGASTRA